MQGLVHNFGGLFGAISLMLDLSVYLLYFRCSHALDAWYLRGGALPGSELLPFLVRNLPVPLLVTVFRPRNSRSDISVCLAHNNISSGTKIYFHYISIFCIEAYFAFPSWYKRSEFGLRAALFFSAATVSGAFGGLLAVRIR